MPSASASVVCDGLARRFGSRVAVEGLSFEVQPGEVFGLLGPNGAGKTTTVRMLTGLITPSEGRASVCGRALDDPMLRRDIGLLTEQPGLYDRLTTRENLTFFMRLNEVDETKAWVLATEYLKRFGLEGRGDEAVGGFSKGMRQKLAIVRCLVHSPKVVFLDEPTSGLDPESARTVRDAVAELATEGRTLLLCSHNLAEVERLCTRVAIIKTSLRRVASLTELRHEGMSLDVRVEGDATALVPKLTYKALAEGSRLTVLLGSEAEAPDAVAALVAVGARIHSVTRGARPLEEAYLELVKEGA